MKLDILAIGVHPDDVELGCSGTLASEISKGKIVGILDLTEGELGTRGTVETRYKEAAHAAQILGVVVRENLRMADGFFKNDEEHQRLLISAIRRYQPEIVFANALDDRHPDHGRAGKMISDACFLAGLRKVRTVDQEGKEQEAWRPKYIFHYIQDRYHEPDFIYDISGVFEKKMDSIKAYTTQFHNPDYENEEPQTYISNPSFLESVIGRARSLGKIIGVEYGEGFNTVKTLGIHGFEQVVQVVT
jgi:N-acetylglucosamine malate deacetylase 1